MRCGGRLRGEGVARRATLQATPDAALTFSAAELDRLEATLGHRFTDRTLLETALTHRSWIEERYPGGHAPAHLSQQRLEFLGDAYFNYVVGRWVFEGLPTAMDGDLSKARTLFTKGSWLAEKGSALGVFALVQRGRGEIDDAARNRQVREDTTEALIGALLLDAGATRTEEIIRGWLPVEVVLATKDADPISTLNEWFQAHYKCSPPSPVYFEEGAGNERLWDCLIQHGGFLGEGTGPTKQEARKVASAAFLQCVREPGA